MGAMLCNVFFPPSYVYRRVLEPQVLKVTSPFHIKGEDYLREPINGLLWI